VTNCRISQSAINTLNIIAQQKKGSTGEQGWRNVEYVGDGKKECADQILRSKTGGGHSVLRELW
jgi:hypothetical protein